MKIGVCLVSRGSPASLEMVIRGLKLLASEENNIKYVVGIDDDDLATGVRMQRAFDNDNSVMLSISPRPLSVGSIWNKCVKAIDAEVYMLVGDDTLCLTQNWDQMLVLISKKHMVTSAHCAFSPDSAVFPIFRKEWLDAAGYLFPEHFPFWFNDTWWQELSNFTFGEKTTVYRDISFGGKVGKTQNMRDVDFWWGFFNATRIVRLKEAAIIRQKLFLPAVDLLELLQHWRERDTAMRKRIPEFENANLSNTAPSERYAKIKQNAAQYLEANNLTLWGDL